MFNGGSDTDSKTGSVDSLVADTEAFSYEQQSDGASTSTADKIASAESYYGIEIANEEMLHRLRSNEKRHGEQVHDWAGEGMPTKIMGRDREMEAFRERQDERPPEVPADIEQRNERSVFRSKDAAQENGSAGQTGVPESVRDVITSSGQSLDADIQRAMEERMGDSFGDVQIHTGPQAANACEAINARAFTVGNHIAFNSGEYDPSSAEGQHVIAHELAHVRQQTGGRLSMLPQDELELEIDPDPELEREAEETAQRVMAGGELGIQRLENTEVHVQRYPGQEQIEQAREQITERLQSDEETSVPADPEVLAAEVEQIKQRQAQLMETLTEARPGAAGDGDWGKTALKGMLGSLAGAGSGAAIGAAAGSVVPGLGTAVGAATGAAISGTTAALTREGVEFMDSNRPGGEGERLEHMYQEISQMYAELTEGKQTGPSEDSTELR